MSRIILSKYDDGASRLVVGWDHPAGGAFWQEFASTAEIKAASDKLAAYEDGTVTTPLTAAEEYELEKVAETEVKREAGMFPGIPLDELRASMPKDLRLLVTDEVIALLHVHAEDPDSGYVGNVHSNVDWTKRNA